MSSLIRHLSKIISPAPPPSAASRAQLEGAALAGAKRTMERSLRAKGLSRAEAKIAVKLHFKALGGAE